MTGRADMSAKRAFSIAEAARYACVSRDVVISWIEHGLLPFEELPGTGKGQGEHRFRRIRKDDMDEFLNRHYHSRKQQQRLAETRPITLLPRAERS